jgi:2-C-methyl-D-erythritol 4-phosphate cytidylyltransferase
MGGQDPIEGLAVLVPFAGSGERLGLGPKAMVQIAGRPLVVWIAEKAERVATEVVIAVPGELVADLRRLCPWATFIAGGETRQDSIELLLSATGAEFVLIQDGARPFASVRLMRLVADIAMAEGAAGAFLSPEVPVARVAGGCVVDAFEANDVRLFQAPQAFSRRQLLEVHALARRNGWRMQSTAQLALRAGIRIRAVEGEKTNIKITTADDLRWGQTLEEFLR